ncbi:MAG: cell division protein ZapA [Xanthomonadales bacterium]|jgi:cell division protein ZapA|nr:cell division protein ZapA [Xanthomonadales bacterium]
MSEPVNLRIADRDYTVGCEPHERDELLEAARLLDTRMRDTRNGNRSASADRVAVLVALNLAHELLQLRRGEGQEQREISTTLDSLSRKLDRLLASVSR